MSLTRLRLMQQAWGEQEMQFADPYAQQVFNERYGRMTLNKARSVTAFLNKDGYNLDWLFANDENIQSFDELRYFISLKWMNMTFRNCPNLVGTLIIPASVMGIGGACIFKTKLTGVEFLAQNFKWNHGAIWECKLLKWIKMHSVEVPQKKTLNNQYPFDSQIMNNTWKLYVPDESVEKYRADHNFQNLGERIRPMSEFKG
nr:MAG TPA: hypothetical protein [Caudoviricetes sp.]